MKGRHQLGSPERMRLTREAVDCVGSRLGWVAVTLFGAGTAPRGVAVRAYGASGGS